MHASEEVIEFEVNPFSYSFFYSLEVLRTLTEVMASSDPYSIRSRILYLFYQETQ